MEQEFYLLITGKTNIDRPFKKGYEYSVAFKRIGCYEVADKDGEGNADKVTCKCKSLDEVTIITEEKKVIFGKPKKGSLAQRQRMLIEEIWQQQHAGEIESEAYYNKRMSSNIEDLKNELL